ncbi:CheR family methyltransferase [Seleniivibrio sp.]|uniref:CheR family methyltransferase n=1 Tax=Seleniivibrio sp. TaxID=2898801 RepID=UPI0025DBAB0E|nr:CheR family methyltransferase [Seleniivibrio sp.]MCD8554478.1 hypothetical protein [Seleniivibrio sp.]
MDAELMHDIYTQKLTSEEFGIIQTYIQEKCGIRLPLTKKDMVEGRIRKRLKALNLSTYGEYIALVFDSANPDADREQLNLIDTITTNKTDFFREPNHFEFLTQKVLPALEKQGYGMENTLNVWSSACSTGEEPYTLAMVLAEYFGVKGNFRVYASDISYSVLERATKAVYTEEKALGIPHELKKKYLLRSKDQTSGLVRIRPELRQKVSFGRLNLMNDNYNLPVEMNVVFCRNVIIYFNHQTQYEIIGKICHYMLKGACLFLGHSESIHGMDLPLSTMAPTVFYRI